MQPQPQKKVEPREIRASHLRKNIRQYVGYFVFLILASIASLILTEKYAESFFFYFIASLVLLGFVLGGLFQLVRMAKLEQYLKTLREQVG